MLARTLYILLLVAVYGKASPQSIVKEFTVAQLQQDYNIFVQSLKEAHPGLYRYTSKKEFDSLFLETKNQINLAMSGEAFYKLLMPLVVNIKCGHTKWNPEGKPDDRYPYRENNLFPLKLYFVNDKAYVLYSYDSTVVIPKKSELLSINGRKIKDIMQQISKYVTADGNVRSSLYEELNHSFNGFMATFIDTSSLYNINLQQDDNAHEVALPATNLKAIIAREEQNKTPYRLPLQLTYPDQETAILTIENFYVDEKEQKYYSFIDSAFKDIYKKQIKNLVLDLRNNEGGEEDWGGYLYSYLTDSSFQYYKKLTLTTTKPYSFRNYAALPSSLGYINSHTKIVNGEIHFTDQKYLYKQSPQKNHFTGNLFVLINGLSFSVTTELTSVIHNHNKAVFIGEETSGAYCGNNSGVFTIVTLPNTKLSLSIPLISFYSNVSGYPYKDRGILPQHEVKRTVEDVLQNRDAVMDYTLRLIQLKQKD